MSIWLLAKKDLRLLLRDWRAAILLLVTPFLLILILGMLVNEGFGQKPDNSRRISLVDLDQGFASREALACLGTTPIAPCGVLAAPGLSQALSDQLPRDDQGTGVPESAAWVSMTPIAPGGPLAAPVLERAVREQLPPRDAQPCRTWAEVVRRDLAQTAGIRLEVIPTRKQAQELIDYRERSAVLVFGPNFSERVQASSFLADGINPFFRDGVDLTKLDAEVIFDPTQPVDARITEQVVQVTMLRVVLPWMIGRAFERLGQPEFIDRLCNQVYLPVPTEFHFLFRLRGEKLDPEGKASLEGLLRVAANRNPVMMADYKQRVGKGVQESLQTQFKKYNLMAKTWAALTKERGHEGAGPEQNPYSDRSRDKYKELVPASLVMFAFFLVLSLGWLFGSERRQGTLKRLRASPLTRTEILLGKLLPSYGVSVLQGLILLTAGHLLFVQELPSEPYWLVLVVLTTSLAAVGLALLVATLARTEVQVALYGTLLVLGLALVGGCVYPRGWMSDWVKQVTRITPHAWALDAYRELLAAEGAPNLALVGLSCSVLTLFGVGLIGLAWRTLKLE